MAALCCLYFQGLDPHLWVLLSILPLFQSDTAWASASIWNFALVCHEVSQFQARCGMLCFFPFSLGLACAVFLVLVLIAVALLWYHGWKGYLSCKCDLFHRSNSGSEIVYYQMKSELEQQNHWTWFAAWRKRYNGLRSRVITEWISGLLLAKMWALLLLFWCITPQICDHVLVTGSVNPCSNFNIDYQFSLVHAAKAKSSFPWTRCFTLRTQAIITSCSSAMWKACFWQSVTLMVAIMGAALYTGQIQNTCHLQYQQSLHIREIFWSLTHLHQLTR